jgi:Amt family ammonium transporter
MTSLTDALPCVPAHVVGHAIDAGDTAWLLAASALVLLMAPGLALFYGGDLTLLGHQAGAALFTIVWTGVLTTIIAFAIKFTIGWRVSEEDEVEGIDFAEHGEAAYDLSTSTSRLGSSSILASSVAKEGVSA